MVEHKSADRIANGAKVSRRAPAPPAPKKFTPEPSTKSEAYLLARANQHKPWARRWLKQHRYSL